MKPGGGKSKGSSFERLVAKRLGLAIFNDSDSFVRTPGSGALATIRQSTDMPFGGDIMQVKHFEAWKVPYSIECKHYKTFDLYNILTRKEKSLEFKAWLQCVRDAKLSGQTPLLIFRANSRPIYTVTRVIDGLGDTIEDLLDRELVTIEGVFTDGKLLYIPFEVFEEAMKVYSPLTNGNK